MLALQILIEVLLSSAIGLTLSGFYMTGAALCARYFTIDDHQPTVLMHRPTRSRYSQPSSVPAKLQYPPLTTYIHHQPLALIDPYSFAYIAQDHPHLLKPLPPRPPPQSGPEQPEKSTNGKSLPLFSPVKNLFAQLVQALRPGWNATTILLALIALAILLILCCNKMVSDIGYARQNRRRDNTHTDAELESLRREADFLARTTQRLTAGLERGTRERDALYCAAVQKNHYQRLAAGFERTAMGLVEGLAVVDEENVLWEYLLDHGFMLPNHVITGEQADEPPNAALHVPVDPPPLG